jgi:hypothetical protein
VPDWAAYMRRHGFGTDEAGDARRREEMASATITPEMLGAIRDEEDRILGAVQEDLSRRAARILEEARAMTPITAEHPPVPGHLLTYRHGKAGTEVTCQCGRWDGWYNGPRSRRRVLDDHAAHAAAELAAEGPIRVKAERADLPKELE